MAGYEDTRQMIINTLTNRLAGTEIQPEDHQEFALAITDYVRSVELLSGNAFIGFAEANTTPVQSDKGQCFYISTVGPGQTVDFVNFIDSNGNAISVSSPDGKMSLVTLIWNTQYWSSQVTTIDTNWSIAQQSGDSESMVMSQKAVTDAIVEAINKLITTDRIENGAVTIGKLEPSIQSLITNISKNASFAGIATPTTNPGTPDGPVFYIAVEPGIYSNFNGISVADGEAVILEWNGSWIKKITGFATQQQVESLKKNKVPINNNSKTKVSDNSDGFYFTDKSGNIIAKILSDGVHAVALYDKDGNEIGSADASIESIKDKAKQDGFYFTDAVGKVIVKITKDGLQAIKILNKDGNEIGGININGENGTLPIILNNNLTPSSRKVHPLYGKDIYSFGDSLCKGTWEKMLADITGANFNKEANELTSWGGTFSGDEGGPLYNEDGYGENGDTPGGLRRAKNFVLMPKEIYGNKDVIFFENVHDAVLESDDISAFKPFMWTRYAVYEEQEFYDTNVAGTYFNNNRSSILQSVGFTTPQVGTMVKMKVKAVTVPLVFSNGATNSGSVKISINGNDFETEVTEGDSIERVIDKISVWSFSDSTGWKNKKLNSTTINLQYVGGNSGSEGDVITFDGQGTGVVATVESKTESIAYRTHAFFSLDVNEWGSPEAWSYYAGYARCYAQWKGVIEYIQRNCPDTKMYMLLFPNSAYSKSYVRADGSFDVEAFYASTQWQQHINNRRCLINIADYYNIPVIDLEKEMNVMCNWETYFPENNVHMKNTLYQRFAEIIASKIY